MELFVEGEGVVEQAHNKMHVMHYECMYTWLKDGHDKCPSCNAKLNIVSGGNNNMITDKV